MGNRALNLAAAAAAAMAVAGIGWWALRTPEPAAPGTGPAPEAAPPAPEALCTFDVREQPLDRVLEYVRRSAKGMEVLVAPELSATSVTLKVRKAPWRDALGMTAAAAGAEVVEERPGVFRLVRVPPPPPPPETPGDSVTAMATILEKCRKAGAAYREAEAKKDFLQMAVAKRDMLQERERLVAKIPKKVGTAPEFPQRDVQARFMEEVRVPLQAWEREFEAVLARVHSR